MVSRHHQVATVPVLTTLAGVPARALGGETQWTLEDREDSTNRLTLHVPLADSADVVTDAEILFSGRRFKITEANRRRVGALAEVVADEVQVELSERTLPAYKLNGARLSAALSRALAGSLWTSAGVHDDTGTYYADFENESPARLLRFLQSQSKQWLRFDSLNRTVALVEDEEAPLERVFTYGIGVSDIEKRSTAPTTTVIEPTGRAGMTIQNVNGGRREVEDFSWYTGLGISLAQARARFTKKEFWHDDRYVYANNLLNDARARLAELSQPQINYRISAASGEADGLRLGDRVWIVDEELGVKLATRIVRVVTSNDAAQNQLELDYLPRSFGSIRSDMDGDSTDPGIDMVQFQVKNQGPVTLNAVPRRVLESTVQVIADTAFQVGVVVRLETTAPALIEGHFLLDGHRIDPEIKQTALAGWATFGLPFLVTQVTEGSKNFDFFMSVSAGAATVPLYGAEMFIVTRAALGGLKNTRPDRSVSEHIGSWLSLPGPRDQVTVGFPADVGGVFVEEISTWLPDLAAPQESVLIAFAPHFMVTDGVIELTGMMPHQVFTIRIESAAGARVGEDAFESDSDGEYTLDMVTEFAIAPGSYVGFLLEFNQTFEFTVEG